MVESLIDKEPIDTGLIYKLLASRTGKPPSDEFEYWYEWFVDEATNETDSDKDTIKWLNDFKCKFDKLMGRI
jgi:hypothetical protein